MVAMSLVRSMPGLVRLGCWQCCRCGGGAWAWRRGRRRLRHADVFMQTLDSSWPRVTRHVSVLGRSWPRVTHFPLHTIYRFANHDAVGCPPVLLCPFSSSAVSHEIVAPTADAYESLTKLVWLGSALVEGSPNTGGHWRGGSPQGHHRLGFGDDFVSDQSCVCCCVGKLAVSGPAL
jgi:hypothetical protein